MYCITCEEVFSLHHMRLSYYENGPEWSECDGPFATCPPPDEDIWEAVFANEPSPDEMEQINSNAYLM